MFGRMRIVAQYLLFAAIATSGCSQQAPTAADFAAQRGVGLAKRLDLFFGRHKRQRDCAGVISDSQTPLFPDHFDWEEGLAITSVTGRSRVASGTKIQRTM